MIAEKLEGLDPKRLEEFQADLENIKETIELNTKKNCLDTLKDIKDMVQNRQDAIEYFDDDSKPKTKELPVEPSQPPPIPERRKLYGTWSGEE